jgi:thiol-disulfide isomerase/thioredoxin
VVVLDFWATYCMPCRLGLPYVDKVAKSRANDATVLAIDTNEDAATARTGQKEMNLALPILVDGDGAVGTKYMADHGIPETVIIGKNGIVRKVMLGLNVNNPADEETELNTEIDAANKSN